MGQAFFSIRDRLVVGKIEFNVWFPQAILLFLQKYESKFIARDLDIKILLGVERPTRRGKADQAWKSSEIV